MDVVDCFEKGMTPEAVALKNEMIDEHGDVDDEIYGEKEVTEFLAAMRMIYKLFKQIGTSAKIPQGRGYLAKTPRI